MTMLEIYLIGIGGFIGAILRYLLSSKLNGRFHFPVGTLFVNLVGSLLIGILIGLALPKVWTVFLVSGFIGALTTFSTLQKEVIEVWCEGNKQMVIWYGLLTYGGGILLAFIGYFLVA